MMSHDQNMQQRFMGRFFNKSAVGTFGPDYQKENRLKSNREG